MLVVTSSHSHLRSRFFYRAPHFASHLIIDCTSICLTSHLSRPCLAYRYQPQIRASIGASRHLVPADAFDVLEAASSSINHHLSSQVHCLRHRSLRFPCLRNTPYGHHPTSESAQKAKQRHSAGCQQLMLGHNMAWTPDSIRLRTSRKWLCATIWWPA